MKQKLLNIALVMTMVLMLVTMFGCSKTNKDQTSSPEGTKEEVTVTVAAEDSTTDAQVTATVVPKTGDGTSAEGDVLTPAASDLKTTLVDGGFKKVYEQYGIKAGTCLSDTMIAQSRYTDLIKENYNSVTLENFMKPENILDKTKSIAAGDIVVEFTKKTTDLLDWAKSNGLSVRGHTLVWYSQTPDWIFYKDFDSTKGLVDRDTMLARMESYIKQVFEQLDTLGYTDMFYAYDVVNEALMEDGTYRDSQWKTIIGEDYIWYAFHYADKYAPKSIKLYYNDYNEQFKTAAIVKLAQSLVDKDGKSLIDGIGCQGHLYTEDSIENYISMLKTFSKLGLDVQITELDVCLGSWNNIEKATDENLKAQGKYYYNLINRIIVENAAGNTSVSAITFWGFADNLSWRNTRSPLVFDSNLKPKYAYYGAIQDHDNAGY